MVIPILYPIVIPFPPIADLLIVTATTSVTINGLDGKAHGGYDFEIYFRNDTATATAYAMYANNDTTATNYTRQELRARGVDIAIGGSTTDAFLIGTPLEPGNTYKATGSIGISSDGRLISTHMFGLIAAQQFSLCTWSKNTVVTDLTSIIITSTVVNGIGVNSRFRLWRKI